MSNERKVIVTIKLNSGEIIYTPISSSVSPSYIERQFINKDEFILFGWVGVKRELIEYYTISFEDTKNIFMNDEV